MKRTELRRRKSPKRGKGLKVGPGPKRKKRINPVNRERKKKRAEECYGEHAERIRALPCAVTGRYGTEWDPVVAAHAWHTRGAGGKARDCIPLLLSLEKELHNIGRLSFQAKYDVDLEALAAHYAEAAANP